MTDQEKERRDLNRTAAYAIALALIVAFCIVLSSCRTQYIQGETITKEVRVVERDTTIITEADSAAINALLYCDSAYNVVLGDLEMSEGERINLEWRLGLMEQNGRTMAALNMKAKEEEQTNNVTIKDTQTTQVTERNIVEHRNTSFAKFCIGFFWTVLSIGIVFAILAILRRRYFIA